MRVTVCEPRNWSPPAIVGAGRWASPGAGGVELTGEEVAERVSSPTSQIARTEGSEWVTVASMIV